MYSPMPNNLNTSIQSFQSTQSTQSTISTLSSHSTASYHSASTTNRCDKQPVNKECNNTNNNNTKRRRHHPLYECYCQARIRSGYELSSTHLTDLPEGSVVTVEEIRGNRAKITAPIHGWISIISKLGVTIIMPLNKETAKIGGKVIYTKKHPNKKHKYIAIHAKIIDYNQNYAMHKIQTKDGKQQWISLKDPNIHYIPKNTLSPSLIHPLKQTEAFFNQFFVTDYPQFKPRIIASNSNSSKKKKENGKNDDMKTSQNEYHKNKQKEENENNHTIKPKWGDAVNNRNPATSKENRSPTICTSIDNKYDDENINKQQNKVKNKKNNDKKLSVNSQKKKKAEKNEEKEVENDEKEEYKKEDKLKEEEHRKKCEEEFIGKIKEIERRIIDHLHMRGYYEDHPDFWRYIAKAKELAIARAEKERQKFIKKKELENKTRNN